MYTPPHFREDQLPVLHDAIQGARLGTLVTMGREGLEASHLPLVIDPGEGEYGTIYGHLSRANGQWRNADTAVPALAVCTGPDAYVTPSWYATKAETGKVVPTWNYVAVHAYGDIAFFDDARQLLDVVTRLTERHERGRDAPWAVSDAPDDYVQGHLKGIVGFRLPIARLQGSWKLSQNKSAADRAGVIGGLKGEGGALESEVAAAMESVEIADA